MKPDSKYFINAAKMLESMDESVLITTAELDTPGPYIIYVNGSFERMTGWKREDVIGKTPRILQGPKTDHTIFNDLKEKLGKGRVWSGRTLNYKKDGSEFYMAWSIVPIKNEKGEYHQHLAVQKDVTPLVLTENKLQQAMREERKRLKEIEETNKRLNTLINELNKTLDLFKKYVPEPIVMKGLTQKEEDIRSGEILNAALLFCDIRGFTPIAEKLSPNQVVHLLNIYYSGMSEVIHKHDGVINQFVGDEIFVSFGAPEPIKNPELSSVLCAIDMVHKLDDISKNLSSIIKDKIIVGIGINFGRIIAGNLGSDERLSYSITGDAVNTAKRIESLTRELPNTILISQSIYEKAKNHISTKPWGEVQVKGKNERVGVYQVIDELHEVKGL
jgi:PAS domain S-box-containing protein